MSAPASAGGAAGLRFDGYRQYSNNGGVYRRWQFTEDAPEVGARVGWWLHDIGPDPDEDDDRFHLREPSGAADPTYDIEPWQVEALFGGRIPEWSPPVNLTREYQAGVREVLRRLEDVVDGLRAQFGVPERYNPAPAPTPAKPKPEPEPEPEPDLSDAAVRRLRRAIPDPDRCAYAAIEVTHDLPAVGLRAGDLLLYSPSDTLQIRCRFRMEPIDRARYRYIVDARSALRLVEASGWLARDGLGGVLRRIGRVRTHWRGRVCDPATAPLKILREPRETPEPVEAGSDDAAIFELLSLVGCRMPVGG